MFKVLYIIIIDNITVLLIQKELKLHVLLKNPHIVECHGFTDLDGHISIVLELSKDGSLDKVIFINLSLSLAAFYLICANM